MRPLDLLGGKTITTKDVLPMGNRFKMLKVAACRIAAEMIQHQSLGNRSAKVLVNEPVGLSSPALQVRRSISLPVFRARPFPATVFPDDEPIENVVHLVSDALRFSRNPGFRWCLDEDFPRSPALAFSFPGSGCADLLACLAAPILAVPNVQVLTRIFMAARAVGSTSTAGEATSAAQRIGACVNDFEMIDIGAATVAAEVIEHHTLWDRAAKVLKEHAMDIVTQALPYQRTVFRSAVSSGPYFAASFGLRQPPQDIVNCCLIHACMFASGEEKSCVAHA